MTVFDRQQYLNDVGQLLVVFAWASLKKSEDRCYDDELTRAFDESLESLRYLISQADEQWHYSFEYQPQRPSGRWETSEWISVAAVSESQLIWDAAGSCFVSGDEVVLGWMDLFSVFRPNEIEEAVYRFNRGMLPFHQFEAEPAERRRIFVDPISQRRFQVLAPVHSVDEPLTDAQTLAWFGKHVIETIFDPVLVSVKSYVENKEKYPMLKKVEDRSIGIAKDFFIERLVAELFGEALLRQIEVGWPMLLRCSIERGQWECFFDSEDPQSWPVLHELAPHDLARRLFNGADGAPGWIQQHTELPAIKDQMRGWAPI